MTTQQPIQTGSIGLRPPEEILTLKKMGTSFPTRISFMRNIIRKIHHQKWNIERREFELDRDGFGHAVYTIHTKERPYSLIVFSHDLAPEKRSDRVIAEAWDATFNLFDGIPTQEDIERLASNTPLQEAGRFSKSELVLGRANKSLRMFSLLLECLKSGQQPDINKVAAVGYLMRTTAVYGSGKFGCADRTAIEERSEIQSSFHAELIAVYLFRSFTTDLIDHIAKSQAPETAVALDGDIKRFLGIGNSTGLGMAPFLLRHTRLLHQWVTMKETALNRVRNFRDTPDTSLISFKSQLAKAILHIHQWNVEDETQTKDILALREDMKRLDDWLNTLETVSSTIWEDIYQFAKQNLETEAVSLIESLMIECNGPIVDELADQMFEGESKIFDPAMDVSTVINLLNTHYSWVDKIDFSHSDNTAKFWYYSEEKLEPRFGDRKIVPGAELEMPLSIARDIVKLKESLAQSDDQLKVGDFLLDHPEFRHLIKRIQTIDHYPYGEVRDNLIHKDTRPIDLLRFKLAFFGASKFDPKSSLWTRINMYQGAPHAHEILDVDPDAWAYPIKPELRS